MCCGRKSLCHPNVGQFNEKFLEGMKVEELYIQGIKKVLSKISSSLMISRCLPFFCELNCSGGGTSLIMMPFTSKRRRRMSGRLKDYGADVAIPA